MIYHIFLHFRNLSYLFYQKAAANPEKEICPLNGIYSMKGVIGPPFLANRHKRNRINKQHGSHHHHDMIDINTGSNSNSNKRHNVYSFRNTENNDQNWHLHSHVKTIRHRRAADIEIGGNKERTSDDDGVLINVLKNELNLVSTIDQLNRNKRDTTNCATMTNMRRTLSFGCTDENTIDVDPSCGDEGEEGEFFIDCSSS